MAHVQDFLNDCERICAALDHEKVEALAEKLRALRDRRGRLFILGVGGGAANASHAANDFRKLCGIEAYAPSDNIAELTARANDEGWDTIFSGWLRVSRINGADALLILSVGGGRLGVSDHIIRAIECAKVKRARVFGIVGMEDGHAAIHGDLVIVVPRLNEALLTPLAEAFQAVILHALASHPKLQINSTKW